MKDPLILVRHILDAIVKIEQYTESTDKAAFENNFLIQDAVIRNIQIIGEASRLIPDDFRDQFPQVEWKKMNGMRNKLVHEYFLVDIETVWNVVEIDLPRLKHILSQILNSRERIK